MASPLRVSLTGLSTLSTLTFLLLTGSGNTIVKPHGDRFVEYDEIKKKQQDAQKARPPYFAKATSGRARPEGTKPPARPPKPWRRRKRTSVREEAERLRTPLAAFFSILLMAGVVLLIPQNAPADLESAIQAYNNGRRKAAIAELVSLAKAGNTHAKYALGVIYGEGKGGVADPEKALKWFREAANEGNSNAQYSLGVMHAKGTGIPRDLVRGLMWFNIAAQDSNQTPFVRMRIISVAAALRRSMTPEQINEAGKLAAKWKPG